MTGRDLARILLDRADDDIRLVRRVAAREVEYAKTHALGYLIGLIEANAIEAPAAVLNASELSPWAVDFRYETDDEPALIAIRCSR